VAVAGIGRLAVASQSRLCQSLHNLAIEMLLLHLRRLILRKADATKEKVRVAEIPVTDTNKHTKKSNHVRQHDDLHSNRDENQCDR